MNNINKEINAESIVFKPQDSNFLTIGNKMNEINNAMLSGISTGLANTITAKRPKMKANMKNKFWKDSFIGLSKTGFLIKNDNLHFIGSEHLSSSKLN